MTIFPDIPTLAAAPLDRVNQLWAGLGYYRRARFLHAGAQQVMRQFGGVLPGDISSLRSIQGIGPYTAGAIASIAFGVMAPCVDGNVERVLSRVCPEANFCNGRGGSSGSGSAVSGVWWTLASQLVGEEQVKGKKEGKKKGKGKDNRFSMDKANDDNNANDGKPENNNTQTSDDDVQLFWPGDLNQALMELGATVCKPRAAAECHKCPLFAENVCGAARQAAEAGLAPEQYGPFMARYPARLANRAAGGRKKQRKETVKRKRGNVDNDDDEYESDGGGTSGVGGGRVRVSSKGVKIRDEKVAVIVAWTRDICDGNIHNENDDGDDGDNHIDNDNDNDRTRVLIMQRPADGLLGGLWESANVVLDNSKTTNIKTNNHANTHALPASGATHADADPDASAQVADRDSVLWAKVLSGCGHDARVAHDDLVYAGKVTHIFSHIRQQLFVYAVRVDGVSSFSSASSGMTGDGRPFRWVSSKQLNEAAIATQMKKVLGRGLRHVGCCDTVQWIGGVEPRKKKGGKR